MCKDRTDKITSLADLKGAKIGVTAPGASTDMIAQLLMKNGLKADDAAFVGVGAGALRSRRSRRAKIDAIANVDPVIAKLEASGKVVVMADARTTEGSDKVFGGTMAAAVVYLKRDFLAAKSQHGAGAGQRLLPDAAVDAAGEPGADRRRRAAGVLAGRQGPLPRRQPV